MAIFLVQHGKSLSKDVDPERGLSSEGISEVEKIAKVARGYEVNIACIIHSGKKRAQQTAEIFAAALKPEQGVQVSTRLGPMDDVASIANTLTTRSNFMLVGHLPFMEKLTSWLITGSTKTPVFKYQNGGIVCMDQEADSGKWFIKWTLMPNIK